MRYYQWLTMLILALMALPLVALTDPGELPATTAVMPAAEAAVNRMDTDGDGKISFDEFKAARLKQIEQQFQFLDVNHDGYVDEVEKSLALEKVKKQLKQLREQRSKPN